MQKKARAAGILLKSQRISALRLHFETPPAAELVNSEALAVVTTILQNTSGEHWRGLGSGVRPRLVAVVKEDCVRGLPTGDRVGVTDQAEQTGGGRGGGLEGAVLGRAKRRREEPANGESLAIP